MLSLFGASCPYYQSSMNGRDMEMCGLPNGIWKRPEALTEFTKMAFTFVVVPVTKINKEG